MLVRHGYGVLLFDRRGEGASDGDFNAFGWDGETDVRAAIDFLERRLDVDPGRIGGLGLSVGDEMLLQTAAQDRRLRAVVSEGAGARSLGEQLEMPGIPAWRRPLSPWLVQTAAVAVLADARPPAPLGDLVREIRQPLLLIQARGGHEDEQLNAIYEAHAGSAATRWVAPGGHTGALAAAPREYERRVVGFLDQALS
jgi:dienelactone hydrolase